MHVVLIVKACVFRLRVKIFNVTIPMESVPSMWSNTIDWTGFNWTYENCSWYSFNSFFSIEERIFFVFTKITSNLIGILWYLYEWRKKRLCGLFHKVHQRKWSETPPECFIKLKIESGKKEPDKITKWYFEVDKWLIKFDV